MKGKTDEEEYQMYEEVYRDKLGGQALLYVYYLDHKSFEKAEKILAEISAKKKWTDGFAKAESAVEDLAVLMDFFQ